MSSECSFFFTQISHLHKNGFALRLALKQRHKRTQKWPNGAGWNYACAGAWPLSRKDVIAENKMAPLLQYFVLMEIIVSIE